MPIDVTEVDIVIDAKLLQPRNASLPIDVTESGMVNDCKVVQSI